MNNIVVAILSALAGFLVWIGQRHFERVAAERLRRETLYVESQRAWLYASDEVREAINEYLEAFVAVGASEGREADTGETWKALEAGRW
jgi:hypothetical protein